MVPARSPHLTWWSSYTIMVHHCQPCHMMRRWCGLGQLWCSSVRRWKRWTSWDCWMVVYDGESGPCWNDTFNEFQWLMSTEGCLPVSSDTAGWEILYTCVLSNGKIIHKYDFPLPCSFGGYVQHCVSPRYSSHTDMFDLAMHQDRPKSGL